MRKVHTLSILAGFALAVSGCHGNTGSNPAADSPAVPGPIANSTVEPRDAAPQEVVAKPANADDKRPVLVCFGDSLTAGLGTGPGQSYPDYLQGDLDQLHYHYRVDNEGVSGNTTKDGVERLPDILALHPAVVVDEFGGNDGLRGLRIEDTRTNLD